MHSRYFTRPYQFLPPYRGDAWCNVLRWFLPNMLRRSYGVVRWENRGVELLRRSLDRKAGIVLAANHSRIGDPFVLGTLALEARTYLYFLASFHMFQGNRFTNTIARGLGAMSVLRDAPDREAIRMATEILIDADRPVVLFPEGTYYRQNDRLGPLQEGIALICRRAAKKVEHPIVVHPVAMKYWFLEDPTEMLRERMTRLEALLRLRPGNALSLVDRLNRFLSAVVAVKEVEYLGAPRDAALPNRLYHLADTILARIELRRGDGGDGGHAGLIKRIRELRQTRVRAAALGASSDPDDHGLVLRELDDLYLCQLIYAHDPSYLRERPSLERIAETLQRFEDDIFETETPLAPLGAVMEVGEPLNVADFPESRGKGEPMTTELGVRIQAMLDALNRTGPPAAWHCPTRAFESDRQTAAVSERTLATPAATDQT